MSYFRFLSLSFLSVKWGLETSERKETICVKSLAQGPFQTGQCVNKGQCFYYWRLKSQVGFGCGVVARRHIHRGTLELDLWTCPLPPRALWPRLHFSFLGITEKMPVIDTVNLHSPISSLNPTPHHGCTCRCYFKYISLKRTSLRERPWSVGLPPQDPLLRVMKL